MQKPKTSHFYKQFRIRRADGRSTTVSVEPELFMEAVRALRGVQNVEDAVRAAALKFGTEENHGTNCSGFVSKQLRQHVKEVRAPV